MAHPLYILFEILPDTHRSETQVYCGPQPLIYAAMEPRPYSVDEVLEWCGEHDCEVDSYDLLHVICPRSPDAAFEFRMRWI